MGFWDFVFGLVLIVIAIDSYILHIVPFNLIPWVVFAMGVIILFTPVDRRAFGAPRPFFRFVRRWVFGVVLIIIGLADFIINFIPVTENLLQNFVVGSTLSFVLLLLFGIIDILSAFRGTRGIQINRY